MTSNEYLERVRDFFGHDTFAMETTGIVIEDAAPGEATVTLDWSARHSNAKGGVMGGVLFTMADLAASIADWKEGEVNMTVDASMQYLHGARIATCAPWRALSARRAHDGFTGSTSRRRGHARGSGGASPTCTGLGPAARLPEAHENAAARMGRGVFHTEHGRACPRGG